MKNHHHRFASLLARQRSILFLFLMSSFLLSTSSITYAADVIINGTFDTEISNDWTNDISGSGTLAWNSFNGGSAQGLVNTGRDLTFSFSMEQSLGTINSVDDVFLSLYWYKWSQDRASVQNDMIVRIIKPAGDSADIWSDTQNAGTSSSLSGNVTALNVSSFFDQNGTYTIKLIGDMTNGGRNSAYTQCNYDNLILDVQTVVPNDPPVVTNILNQTIGEGETFQTITLDNFVSDPDNTDAEMTWTYSGNTELIVDITNRIATITTPNVDWNGAETITFRATDPGSQFSEDPATFTVNAQNDPPVVTDIPNQTIAEGASFTTITLDDYVSDVDNVDSDMIWTYSGNTELLVDITNRIATITAPNGDWNGAETITFRATDPGALFSEDPATFTVNAQNDPPVVTDIPNQTIAEGGSFTTITLDNYVSDVDNTDAEMTWTYTGNTELIVDITNRIATITTPSPTWNGVETITLRATDPGALFSEDPATFTVTAQNDSPVVTDIPNQTIAEGASFTTITLDNYVSDPDNIDSDMTWTYTGNTELLVDITNRIATITTPNVDWNGAETITFRATDPGALFSEDPATFTVNAQNDPPIVTDIPNQTIEVSGSFTTITLDDYVSDVDNIDAQLTWTYTGNTELLVDITARIATITTPNGSWTGVETITFRATDPGLLFSEDPATFTVTAVNAPPVVNGIPDQTIAEGASFTTITLDNFVSDPDNADTEMTWTYSGNTELLVDITNRIATITTPNGDWNGAETITFRATDPGTLFSEDAAIFTVNAQNDPPVVTDIPNQTIAEGGSFTTITLDNYVSDIDNTDAEMTWTYSGNTELIVDITARIATITTPSPTWNGAETITFRATDPGLLFSEDPATFTVNAQNDPPVVTDIPNQTIAEGASFTTITLDNYVSDPDNIDSDMTWTYSGNTELLVDITNRIATITTPNVDWNGAEAITFRATDPGALFSEDPATFTVTAQNDAPTLTNSTTAVSVSPVNRIDANSTVISATFTDIDQPAVSSFNITFKIREPNNITELILVNNQTHGNGGLTVIDNGSGSYTASYTYNPSDVQTVGLYDLYFEVSDGTASAIDDFTNNIDELEINEIVANEAPIIVASATAVSPPSIDRVGAITTTFTIPFSDADVPAITSFLVTIEVRAPYNESILPLITTTSHGQNGLTISDDGGGNYTATYSWDPADNITVGYYDLAVTISDGSASDTDFFADNLDELLISNGGENVSPIIGSDASYATPAGVERIGTNLTTIGALFLDSDLPGVNAFTINIKIREPDNSTEIIFATDATNGTQGITVTDQGSGIYRVETTWDPSDIQTLGFYDIYISVSDGSATSIDDYANNSDELEVYDAVSNNPPVVTAGATSVSPISLNRIGTAFTTVSAEFTDADIPGSGDFTVTMKLLEPDNSTEIILVNAAKHTEQGLNISHISGSTYKASVLWDPPDIQTTGTYDLYFDVEDNFAGTTTDDYSNNLDELTLTTSAIIGDGYLLRRDHTSDNCGGPTSGCHNLVTHQAQPCLTCHTPHGTTNIYMIRETITTPNSGDRSVIFKTLGTGDPYNDPDPIVGDPTSGVMADSTDDVYTGVCEVCHTTAGHHRNDGSQPPPNHNDATNCISCHPHSEGFAVSGGGESSGGSSCSCHASIFSPMNTSTSSYHHMIDSDSPDYATASKTCLMCHVDHDIFRPDLNTGFGNRGSNLRSSINITPSQGNSTSLSNSDYSSAGDGGICLSCHTSVQTKGYVHPDGTTETIVIDKTNFDAATSSHNYSVPSTFNSDGSSFNANCVKCHTDDAAYSYQDAAGEQFGAHNSDFGKLLTSMGIAAPTDPLEEKLCYQCHSTTSNPNAGSNQDYYGVKTMSATSLRIEDAFNRTNAHPITATGLHNSYGETGVDLADGNRHAECADCHVVHEAIQGTHDGTSQLVSNALKGVWGVEPTSWPAAPTPSDNANVFVAPSGYNRVEPAQNEYQICLKCHSNYTTLPTGSRNIAEEINPNYPSTHGITIANQNPFCNTTTMFEPWGSSGSTYCSDCHRSDVATDPEGPHGSNADHLLVATVVSDDVVGTPLCNVCHRSTTYWDGSAAASRYDQHPATKGAHQLAQGCFACHMWDYASTAGLGVTTTFWNGGNPDYKIFVHGQNKVWNFNDEDGSAGTGQPVDAFVNGMLANVDFTNKQCWSEVCKTHAGTTY